jgi:hypothetical protein
MAFRGRTWVVPPGIEFPGGPPAAAPVPERLVVATVNAAGDVLGTPGSAALPARTAWLVGVALRALAENRWSLALFGCLFLAAARGLS